MAAFIICQSTSGMPIFVKRKGEITLLPFPITASMFGVETFCTANNATLISTCSSNSTVIWKRYQELVFILGSSGQSMEAKNMNRLLGQIYQALIICLGEERVHDPSINVLKKECKVALPLIGGLLEMLHKPTSMTLLHQPLSKLESPVGNKDILDNLYAFVQSLGTVFGCVKQRGKIIAATKEWYSLSTEELALLDILLDQCSAEAADIPVFLPVKSPKVPYRLIKLQLSQSVEISCLVGPSPHLHEFESEVVKHFKALMPFINPSKEETSRKVDSSILGYVILNSSTFVSASYINSKKNMSFARRQEIIDWFIGWIEDTYEEKPAELIMNFEYYNCHFLYQNSWSCYFIYPREMHNSYIRACSMKCFNHVIEELSFVIT
uniref:EOG090X07E6 n=1 Tax=Lynceus sp. MCZ IZ 141354 TaxID=1930659 RepID=A0A9N6WR77_9CRUS|nr:EOG090X07E6 [Lynceus sp. MCZ IZ 141354]